MKVSKNAFFFEIAFIETASLGTAFLKSIKTKKYILSSCSQLEHLSDFWIKSNPLFETLIWRKFRKYSGTEKFWYTRIIKRPE